MKNKLLVFLVVLMLFQMSVMVAKPAPVKPVTKKIMLLIFNPILESKGGVRLNQYMGWFDPEFLTNQVISDLSNASGGYVKYTISSKIIVDGIPVKEDGFQYTDESYLSCWTTGSCHSPDLSDYNKILTTYNVCTKLNKGQIDELWMWGAPYFGFYESRLAGPNGYWYNSPPLTGTTCNKLLPIMGYSYERYVGEALESYGHRVESTITHVFNGWDVTQSRNDWDRYGHNLGQTPVAVLNKTAINESYYQCGSIHYGPNSLYDYEWGSQTVVKSNCDDWLNYPNFKGVTKDINCQAWGCEIRGHHKWWYTHLPKASGSTNGILNNWWYYIINP